MEWQYNLYFDLKLAIGLQSGFYNILFMIIDQNL